MKKLAAIWILCIVGGFWFFRLRDMDNEKWWDLYYIWDKGKDVIAAVAILVAVRRVKGLSLFYKTIIPFLVWRVLWEPVKSAAGWEVNNKWENFIFVCLLAFSLLAFLILELKWRKPR